MKTKYVALATIALSIGVEGQNLTKKDSLIEIEEVVITGQFSPKSINRSIYKVEIISEADIKKMAASSISEVLNNNLNLQIIPDKNSGNSQISIMGLGSNYSKILVDNIPIVGDNALGNEIDLNKISLDDVERIEIVKGSMGVEYGNNAVAGVINIITKKNLRKIWNISGFLQEETVGKEYDWYLHGKGRHIQSLTLGHRFSNQFSANINLKRNDFKGFWAEKKSFRHFEQDGKRGYDWQPKEQWNASASLNYNGINNKISYRFSWLSEEMNYYSPVLVQESLGGGERTFIATDSDYFTKRFGHHLSLESSLFKKTKFFGDLSYQKQVRDKQNYHYDVPARNEISRDEKKQYFSTESWYSRGTLSNFLNNKNFDLQTGYEADYTQGFADATSGLYNQKNIVRKFLNAAVFASSEFKMADDWYLRAGVRANFSNRFKSLFNYSFTAKHRLNEHSNFRAVVGTAYRYPTFTENYTYFVDSNHDVRGNENLRAEKSLSGSLLYDIHNDNGTFKWNLDASTTYLQVTDRIDLAVVNPSPLKYQYININHFQSWLSAINAKFSIENLSANAGFSIIGVAKSMEDSPEDYRYSPEANAAISYTVPNWGFTSSVFYKYTGKSTEYVYDPSVKGNPYRLGERAAFSMLDATLNQYLFKKTIEISAGVRNIFNVTEVANTAVAGTAHNAASATQGLFYGRSWFAKMAFNF